MLLKFLLLAHPLFSGFFENKGDAASQGFFAV
jgi:hypothetical protein